MSHRSADGENLLLHLGGHVLDVARAARGATPQALERVVALKSSQLRTTVCGWSERTAKKRGNEFKGVR